MTTIQELEERARKGEKLGRRLEIDGKFYRWRRGKLVFIKRHTVSRRTRKNKNRST